MIACAAGAVYIARLALTAVFAYLIALRFAGNKGPVLVPLTALLVIQVSLSHPLRSSAGRRSPPAARQGPPERLG
jgi:hypothetical protein